MVVRRRHLLIFVTMVFLTSMLILNIKYDPLNRVPGITNEARVLIDERLSKEDRQYIIDNAVPVSNFLQFIQMDGFNIRYHAVYRKIYDLNLFTNAQEVVDAGNISVRQLELQGFPLSEVPHNVETIYLNNMFYDFIYHEGFRFDEIYIYDMIRREFEIKDSSFIDYSQAIKRSLTDQGITKRIDIEATLTQLKTIYYPSTFKQITETLMNQETTQIVLDPLSITVLVNPSFTIGNFQMSLERLGTLGDRVRSVNPDIQAQNEAITKYIALCNAINSDLKSDNCGGLIVESGLIDYDLLGEGVGGFDDRQIGLTFQLMIENTDFFSSDTFKWLTKNAHKYGYIFRYPQGSNEQRRMIRYVGDKLASELNAKNKTLEQYYGQ